MCDDVCLKIACFHMSMCRNWQALFLNKIHCVKLINQDVNSYGSFVTFTEMLLRQCSQAKCLF